jgi:SAM-dependent methyltransferase
MAKTGKLWYQRIFDDMGKNYFLQRYTRGTVQEVSFLARLFEKDHSIKILDVGCGPGRHSLALAEKDYSVTGVDLSRRFLQIAKSGIKSGVNSCQFVRADARSLPFKAVFDWAICLCEGAFSLMENTDGDQKILHNIANSLRSKGHLVLDVLNASYAFRHPHEDDYVDVSKCRGYWTEYYAAEDGTACSAKCSNRYYTVPEIELRLQLAGMQVLETWGCQSGNYCKKKLALDDFEFLVLAQKI